MLTLCDAIDQRLEVEFFYDGRLRIVQPATLGINTKRHEALRGYLVGGASRSGDTPFWRSFLLHKMVNVIVTERQFRTPPPLYRQFDTGFTIIYCQLEAA